MSTGTSPQPVVKPALLFVLSSFWIVVSLAGGRLAGSLAGASWYDAVSESVTAAMLLAGFYLMAALGVPDLRRLSSVGFVRRPGAGREVGIGAALGWGTGLVMVLPALLTGNLHLRWDGLAFKQTVESVVALVAFTLVLQLVLSGLPVRLLVRTMGQGWTVFAAMVMGACLTLTGDSGQGRHLLFAALAFCIVVVAFLRTRAIWLSLGLQLGYSISLQMLFGLRSPYTPVTSGVVQGETTGPAWFTGGLYGPESSVFAVLILLAALVVLHRVTRDYAWHYTYQPIVAAGYPMDVPPPAEHVREAQLAAPAPLVQIGGTQPSAISVQTDQTER